MRDGEIYARGAADDKGQVFMHFKAIEAHMKQNGRLPVNIKVILEGEEEVGSVNLDNFVRANKEKLAASVVVISDSAMFARGVPSICYGLRGLVYFQMEKGETVVIKPGKTLDIVARNTVGSATDEIFRAGLVPIQGRLFTRSQDTVYCIGGGK